MEDPRPLIQQLEPGSYAICRCGKTGNAPFCDGSHSGSEFTPELIDVEATGRTVAWCVCRTTGNPPYCDGSHKKLWKNPLPPKEPS